MIRVTQTFKCDHPRVPRPDAPKPSEEMPEVPEALRLFPEKMPVVVKSQGHSVVLEERVCFCTGKPVKMTSSVKFEDPDPVLT